MLSITNYQRNVSQNYNVISPNTDQNGHHQKVYRQSWRGCGEKGTLLHCCWECKLLPLLWRKVSMFLKKLKIELPILSNIALEVELLDHMVMYFYFSEEAPYCFPQWLYHFTFLPTVQNGSFSLHPFQHSLFIVLLMMVGHSDQSEMISHYSFDLHFSNIQ